MLYLIGAGLTADDLSIKSLKILNECSKIYLEIYTSKLLGDNYQSIIDKPIHLAHRSLLENTDLLVLEAADSNIALLVIGSPLFATTHSDLLLRCKTKNVNYKVIHNVSIFNVIGCCGLYSYSFGRTVSVPFFEPNWKPSSYYLNILKNKTNSLHTLCLLDLRITETNSRYMTAKEAVTQFLQSEEIEKKDLFHLKSKIFVISNFGSKNESILYKNLEEVINEEETDGIYSIVVPCEMDVLEKEFVDEFFEHK